MASARPRPIPVRAHPGLRQALGATGPDRLDLARAALDAGAQVDLAALRTYLQAPSLWSDGPLQSLLQPHLPAPGELASWSGSAAQALFRQVIAAHGASKLEWLVEAGLPAPLVVGALLSCESNLDPPALGVLDRLLGRGVVPAPGEVGFSATQTEDASRCMVLARHGHLDPNAPLNDGHHEVLTYAQILLLYSRPQGPCLDLEAWRRLGADFISPLADGRLPATALLSKAPGCAPGSRHVAPIFGFRLHALKAMVESGFIDWHAQDAHGHTPFQCLMALPKSDSVAWRQVEQACLRQAQAQRLEARLPAPAPAPGPAVRL